MSHKMKFILQSALIGTIPLFIILLFFPYNTILLLKNIFLLITGNIFFANFAWSMRVKEEKYQYLIYSIIAFLLIFVPSF